MASVNPGPWTKDELAAINDEDVLNQMIDKAQTFEERSVLRAALRDLLQRNIVKRQEERAARQADLRQQATGDAPGAPGAGGRRSVEQKKSPVTAPIGKTSDPSVVVAQKCPTTPNYKNVKQMLLDWCRAKTEPYEGVNIQNFSSSFKDGVAFCALVHRFFPDAFDYSTLNPNEPRQNFHLAFSTAERLAGCPSLLDPDDLVRMPEPDWKCVYTYIQEFYRSLVEKGLVKTKKRP
ncbi:unnamed protein product [Knipowitschia caucasica]|uniref:Calponin-homology (CH) domain-containing protein n=1 Tax=Knipowitschia caucasica TaxID=637954 RepID=A0AAV2IWV2_KNICA